MKVIHAFHLDGREILIGKTLEDGAYVYKAYLDGGELATLTTEFADIVSDIAYSGNDADTIVADELERCVRSELDILK